MLVLGGVSLVFGLSLPPTTTLVNLLLFMTCATLRLSGGSIQLIALRRQDCPALRGTSTIVFRFSHIPNLLGGTISTKRVKAFGSTRGILTRVNIGRQTLRGLARRRPPQGRRLVT